MKDIFIALIGCGRIAGHHCEAIKETPGIELLAVCDLDTSKSTTYAQKYGVKQYSNYHQMLNDLPQLHVVAVITPSGMHYEHTNDILKRYQKHVVVEKPTFLRIQHLRDISKFATSNSLAVFPVFQNRYNKAVRRVRKAIDEHELGEIQIVNVRVRWCRPQKYYDLSSWRGTLSHDGGVLSNQGIHHLDLIRYLGGEVESVQAIMRTFGVKITAEDTVVGTFTYESGAVGSLEVTTAARPEDFEASLSVIGSKGFAQIGGIAVNELQVFTPEPEACSQNSVDFLGIEGAGAVYGYGHFDMYRDIVAHLTGASEYPIDFSDCMLTLRLLHAFYVSDELGKSVSPKNIDESERLGIPDEAISDLYRICSE
ncbi:MAG: Gfo/Idh/MocA family oxidoreductase [Pseudomonadota bacterium]|nr:Gfo/Idh/MocA family oxidoreductase [Pseudomonadota bacterium]